MYYPSLKEAGAIAASGVYRKIPVSRVLLSDFITPIQALRVLRAQSGHCFLLESAADREGWGRYSFLGYDPTLEVTCTDGVLRLRGSRNGEERTAHPGRVLRRLLAEHRSPRVPGLPPFTGGLVGNFSYDYIKYAEPTLKLDADDQEGFHDMDLMLFEKLVVFDHFRQELVLIANADAEDLDRSYPAACAQLERMVQLLRRGRPIPRNAAVPCQDGGTVRHTAHAVGIPCPFPVTRPPALRGHAPFFSGALSCRASPFRARHLPYLGAPP